MVLREFIKLLLCVLLSLPLAAHADTHSLSYNFSITAQPKPQQPWREIQGQMDQMVFLSFCCGGEVNPVGTLGRKLNSTKTWEPQIEMLKDVTEELRNKLLDPKPEIFPTSDVPTLQGMMRCENEASGKTHMSWQFGFNGQINLLFSSDNRTWTELHPGATWLKTALENDEHMTTLLQKVSAGDCQKWLLGFLPSRKEMLGTTAPSTMTPKAVQSKDMAMTINGSTWALLFLLLVCCILTAWKTNLLHKCKKRVNVRRRVIAKESSQETAQQPCLTGPHPLQLPLLVLKPGTKVAGNLA
ncbi:UL16-binding protein 1-like [Ochotona curzoniae]|uniref:UL16-binding protein 1-like n=1 Tax=Ochotona curzoniae TaxID=130825 RepID=UPI001B34D9B4|nr:UL16-binding protein 1-like [Ochotona curzoniae]XP_040821442.1 UL16-binding protein 1-like [Ochotona curzoniae]XP_040821443.1 UL16-binding protein 1-like [Ochotona curzoniae]XP_040821444.1 UL16-binding protein 1-like [Ochotona curzoniae]